jgi:hypothetical protein
LGIHLKNGFETSPGSGLFRVDSFMNTCKVTLATPSDIIKSENSQSLSTIPSGENPSSSTALETRAPPKVRSLIPNKEQSASKTFSRDIVRQGVLTKSLKDCSIKATSPSKAGKDEDALMDLDVPNPPTRANLDQDEDMGLLDSSSSESEQEVILQSNSKRFIKSKLKIGKSEQTVLPKGNTVCSCSYSESRKDPSHEKQQSQIPVRLTKQSK